MYHIDYDKKAGKILAKIQKHDREAIKKKIDKLAEDPRPPGVEPLQGEHAGYYRIRFGDYRIIYEIRDTKLLILVVKIGNRKDIYKKK